MKDIEGRIQIDLYPQQPVNQRVRIESSRPVHASRVFHNKSVDQVLHMLPLMYSVCGVAQARTATRAITGAIGREEDPSIAQARDLLVLTENLREHWFRILVEWPGLFELPQQTDSLSLLGQLLPEFHQALFVEGDAFSLSSQLAVDYSKAEALVDRIEQALGDTIYQDTADDWLKADSIDAVYHWSLQHETPAAVSLRRICDLGFSSQGCASVAMMGPLDNQRLARRFTRNDHDEFVAQPTWLGQCLETTPLTRHWHHPLIQSLAREFDNGLLTRWTARLVELATIPGQMRELLNNLATATNLADSSSLVAGLAQTEAARGRLIHQVQVADNTVTRYQILAPTEWNFHPKGLIAQSLDNLTGNTPRQLNHLATLLINAIDPCVGYALRVW